MNIDFTLNYPCYSPMRTPQKPRTFTSENDQCVAILTDADLLGRFFGNDKTDKTLIRTTFETPEALATFLEQPHCTKKGIPITHVLIDPVDPSKHARCYPILEFARHVVATQ